MKVNITPDNELVIKVKLAESGTPSRSGATTVLATSRGNQFIGNVNGKPVYLQMNVLQTEPDHDIQTKGRDEQPLSNVIQMSSSTGKRPSQSVKPRRRAA